jgi:hypothetical protein
MTTRQAANVDEVGCEVVDRDGLPYDFGLKPWPAMECNRERRGGTAVVPGAVASPQQRRHVRYSARCEQDVATIFNDLTANVPVVFLSSSLTAPSDAGFALLVVPVAQ